jgi:hypothetical protein
MLPRKPPSAVADAIARAALALRFPRGATRKVWASATSSKRQQPVALRVSANGRSSGSLWPAVRFWSALDRFGLAVTSCIPDQDGGGGHHCSHHRTSRNAFVLIRVGLRRSTAPAAKRLIGSKEIQCVTFSFLPRFCSLALRLPTFRLGALILTTDGRTGIRVRTVTVACRTGTCMAA